VALFNPIEIGCYIGLLSIKAPVIFRPRCIPKTVYTLSNRSSRTCIWPIDWELVPAVKQVLGTCPLVTHFSLWKPAWGCEVVKTKMTNVARKCGQVQARILYAQLKLLYSLSHCPVTKYTI